MYIVDTCPDHFTLDGIVGHEGRVNIPIIGTVLIIGFRAEFFSFLAGRKYLSFGILNNFSFDN